ncbi:hypothetical protein [Clostridium massiliamazoniense]|uniref:hypothetical protein n=1 Tax=Clostridium massiliamazoniense TaxID=1347366 RepID=UPI0006D7DD2B|nr:hypothetical protein [Clostridium massiliamazoniense]
MSTFSDKVEELHYDKCKAKIKFDDEIKVKDPKCDPVSFKLDISVRGKIKLWCKKCFHVSDENDCSKKYHCDPNCCELEKGSNLGIILCFGNDGVSKCPGDKSKKVHSVSDRLCIPHSLKLKLVDCCIPKDFVILVYKKDCKELIKTIDCKDPDSFHDFIFSEGEYELVLSTRDECKGGKFFDIPCNFICCLSLLFEVDFECER